MGMEILVTAQCCRFWLGSGCWDTHKCLKNVIWTERKKVSEQAHASASALKSTKWHLLRVAEFGSAFKFSFRKRHRIWWKSASFFQAHSSTPTHIFCRACRGIWCNSNPHTSLFVIAWLFNYYGYHSFPVRGYETFAVFLPGSRVCKSHLSRWFWLDDKWDTRLIWFGKVFYKSTF